MNEMKITFNGQLYDATYNKENGYYEVELIAPKKGGLYNANISFLDILNQEYEDTLKVQVFNKKPIKLETNKVKDIIENSNYEILIDEETNANTLIDVLKKSNAKAKDIVAIKKNNTIIYWGIVKEIQNEDGKNLYEYTLKYITNMFDRNIKLENEDLIKTTGIEDFIAKCIINNFISNKDKFINIEYIKINVKTHTKKQVSVSNVENGIFNLHTYMTNCTQNYDIVYSFFVENKNLNIDIENKSFNKELIDTKAQAISNYVEVFETDFVSKVEVLTSTDTYTLFLLTDRTTTTDMNNPNRADGKIETVYTENYEDAAQVALDVMKSNSYNHNITFTMYERLIKVGTPIAIKTKESIILDTYISAIKITPHKFYEYTCGNIRINFLDKLLKERNN